ncbi:MAG: zinc ribbon domain-containing protein [Bacilli bacterium]|nr:zinc ribbon domain-containing protein [Bacilli bacterium]
MYCSKCGKKLDNKAIFCSECGNEVNNQTVVSNTNNVKNSGSSFGWGVLGFFIPLAGLILFLVWKTDRPKDSKAAGIGALIGMVALVLLYILLFVLAFSIGYSSVSNSIYY